MVTSRLAEVELSQITAAIQVRKVSQRGVKQLEQSIRDRGYLERYPIAVAPLSDGGYKLLDGTHRVEAAGAVGLTVILAQIFEGLTPNDEYRIAYESNAGQDSLVPQDWTDDAEFIWSLAGIGKTQQEIAEIMHWSRAQVSQYLMLRNICADAWAVVVATTKKDVVADDGEGLVASSATTVARLFTEGLLRAITSLTPEQQLELVKGLVASRLTKEQFRSKAERYKARNALHAEAARCLVELPTEYLARAKTEIETGVYDKECLDHKGPGPTFRQLIQQYLEEHAHKQNYRLICADLANLTEEDVASESVDTILTDPPYGREYLPLIDELGKLAARVLKPGGSLLAMVGQSYLPEMLNSLSEHLTYHWTVAYVTPGGQSAQLWQKNVNSFWKPVLWFVKGQYQDKWAGDVVQSAVNDNDKRHHKWGQSETGMTGLVEKFTKQGQTILDPFLGGGTTGVVAKRLSRKFIGVDIDEETVKVAARRMGEDDLGDEAAA